MQARAGVAQMAERPPCKRQVSGSIPLTGSRSDSQRRLPGAGRGGQWRVWTGSLTPTALTS
jgi:hypothetical protein